MNKERSDAYLEKVRRYNRRVVCGLVGLIAVAVLLGYGGFRLASSWGARALVQANGNPVGGSFRVVSMGGSIVTEGDFRGDWLLVWFVDPRCPVVLCRPPLRHLDVALMTLRQEGRVVRPLVVSLDATAEYTDDLRDYVMAAAPHIMPFYATPNMIRAMTALYHVPLEEDMTPEKQPYYRSAPSFVLMDPHSRYVASLPASLTAEALTERLRSLTASK